MKNLIISSCLIVSWQFTIAQDLLNEFYIKYSREHYVKTIEEKGLSPVNLADTNAIVCPSEVKTLIVQFNSKNYRTIEALSPFYNVESILFYGPFQNTPADISNLHLLKEVVFCGVDQKFLDSVILQLAALPNLEQVRLIGIKSLPNAIVKLPHLKTLSISNSQKISFCDIHNSMDSLQIIEIFNTKVSFNKSFKGFKNLKAITLTNTKLKRIPDFLFYSFSINYIVINNISLKKTEVDNIAALSSLECIKLIDCQIKHFPDCLGKLKFLSVLMLSNNKISVLPETINDFKNLKLLDISNNPIKKNAKIDSLILDIAKAKKDLKIIR